MQDNIKIEENIANDKETRWTLNGKTIRLTVTGPSPNVISQGLASLEHDDRLEPTMARTYRKA